MQVPSHVEYERATSVEHALALLGRPDHRVLAGGHSLIPMMKLRLAQPGVLVDINGLAELAYIKENGGQLRIGALARHADLLDSATAGQHYPIFHDAERVVADPIVRLWGTIGGSLCQADPSEDLSAVFAALRATAVIRGQDGDREVPVRESRNVDVLYRDEPLRHHAADDREDPLNSVGRIDPGNDQREARNNIDEMSCVNLTVCSQPGDATYDSGPRRALRAESRSPRRVGLPAQRSPSAREPTEPAELARTRHERLPRTV